MKQVLQNLRDGTTEVVDVPNPMAVHGQVLIRTLRSIISPGTERMLVDFSKANLLEKARQQPDKFRQILDKVRTDGICQPLRRCGKSWVSRCRLVIGRDTLARILDAINEALGDLPVIFPVHPRTRSRIEQFGLQDRFAYEAGKPGIFLTEPLNYVEFLSLNCSARIVLTDSGGLQEETTILGVPCVTLRENTERPITVTEGTNRIAGTSHAGILTAVADALAGPARKDGRPEKWDGKAAERIVETILTFPAM